MYTCICSYTIWMHTLTPNACTHTFSFNPFSSLSLSLSPSPYLFSHFCRLMCVVEGRRVVILFLVTLYPNKLDGWYLLGAVGWKLCLASQLVLIEQLGWQGEDLQCACTYV